MSQVAVVVVILIAVGAAWVLWPSPEPDYPLHLAQGILARLKGTVVRRTVGVA